MSPSSLGVDRVCLISHSKGNLGPGVLQKQVPSNELPCSLPQRSGPGSRESNMVIETTLWPGCVWGMFSSVHTVPVTPASQVCPLSHSFPLTGVWREFIPSSGFSASPSPLTPSPGPSSVTLPLGHSENPLLLHHAQDQHHHHPSSHDKPHLPQPPSSLLSMLGPKSRLCKKGHCEMSQ